MVEGQTVVLAEDGDRVCRLDELAGGDLFELGVYIGGSERRVQRLSNGGRTVSLLVTLSLSLLHFRVVHLGLVVGRGGREILEDGAGVKQTRVDALGGLEAETHDEDFGRDVTGRWGFGRMDLCEELVENPQ